MAKAKAKTEIQKGSVFIQTTKGVYPYAELTKAENNQTSKQAKVTSKWMNENGLIPPPYTPEVLLTLYESNSVFWRCVEQLSNDVAGLGWNLKIRDGQKENKVEKKRLDVFLNRPNSDDNFRNIIKRLLVDWGAIGWYGLEVVKNNMDEVSEIYHVPAHTLRVHKDKNKYCQTRNNNKVWFKKFGYEKDILSKDGKEIKSGGKAKDKANELIFYRNSYPKSDYYGVPNALSAVGDIIGLIGLRDYNLAFFENYGVPSAIIILEGEWDEGSDKKVTDFLNKEFKGAEKAHRTLVVTQPEHCKFTYTPLGISVKEASFKLYEQARRDSILIAYSMPPERIGIRITGKLGGNVAEEATTIYIQSVVEPLQNDLEDMINNKLLKSEVYEFKFTNIDVRNINILIEKQNTQIEHGTKTPNEARRELGLPAYEGGDKFYMISSLAEVGEPDEPLSKIEKEYQEDKNVY